MAYSFAEYPRDNERAWHHLIRKVPLLVTDKRPRLTSQGSRVRLHRGQFPQLIWICLFDIKSVDNQYFGKTLTFLQLE